MKLSKEKKEHLNSKIIIAGPCAAESRAQILETAKAISEIDSDIILRAGIWKPRTMPGCFQGVGEIGIDWMVEAKEKYGIKISTEVATKEQAKLCIEKGFDAIWIGARTSVNPFYVEDIANACKGSDLMIMVKNPIHPDLNAWIGSIERFYSVGLTNIYAIHRGFHPLPESEYRNYPNWSIPIELKTKYPNLKVLSDPSHMAGNTHLIPKISQDAIDLNLDGLMIETHISPEDALSDKDQQLNPDQLLELLNSIILPNNDLSDISAINRLSELRGRIDKIDNELIEFFSKRMIISKKIAEVKQQNNLPLFQPRRWANILDRICDLGEERGLRREFVTELLNVIHTESIEMQKNKK